VNRDRHLRAPWEWGTLVLLLLVAFWFRTHRLADVPPGLHHDDVKNVMLVEKILAGDLRVYYRENFGHEPLYHWLQAVWFSLVGSGYPEVRLLSVGISMAGLAIIYCLVRRLQDGRWRCGRWPGRRCHCGPCFMPGVRSEASSCRRWPR
jgi:hypothetical protein